MSKITATFTLNGHELTADVVNAGDWFGKTWLICIEGGFTPLFLIVEADSASDAINELADSEEFGHHIIVDNADLTDYSDDDRHYGPSGQIIDTDWLSIHGCEGCAVPFSCRYHGDDLPAEGVLPTDFYWDDFGDEEE
ncbi:MAG: hypothetical protein H6824_10550 [Planctomycetaceae bacterium]|nr:hypothetical protein [Planctomycetaceae bacterium]